MKEVSFWYVLNGLFTNYIEKVRTKLKYHFCKSTLFLIYSELLTLHLIRGQFGEDHEHINLL
jgi:hypothetical protein